MFYFRCILTASDSKSTKSSPPNGLISIQEKPKKCICGIPHKAQRIIGGTETGVNEYPWQVGLLAGNKRHPFCGGSIITNQHILTAAHCLKKRTVSDISVLLGEHDTTDSDPLIVPVIQISNHPNFDRIKLNYDFAILTLERKITFSSTKSPVCLPSDTTKTFVEKKAKVTGWGLTVAKGSAQDVSTTLREVELKVLPNYECANFYNGEIYRYFLI